MTVYSDPRRLVTPSSHSFVSGTPWIRVNPNYAQINARQALADSAWQQATRVQLLAASQQLATLLAPLGKVERTALFCTLRTPHPAALAEHFARHAILLRRFDEHGLLRFGLPGDEAGWQRLATVIGMTGQGQRL